MVRFRPNGIDLALDDVSVWRRHQASILMVGLTLLVSGTAALTLSYTHLRDAQTQAAEVESSVQAARDAERSRLQRSHASLEAARDESRYIAALQKAGWLDLLRAFETVGKASGGRVVLLSLTPEERQSFDGTARVTAVALTESGMVDYLDRLRRTEPIVAVELVSHSPVDDLNKDSRQMVFLVHWSSSRAKPSVNSSTGKVQ